MVMRSDRGYGRPKVVIVVVIVGGKTERVAVVVAAGEEGESAGGLLGIVVVREGVFLRGRWRVEA